MAYYKIGNDYTTDVVLGSLIDAANRGVKVRFILDGMFRGIGSDFNEILYAFEENPNIEFKYYEKPNLLKPWTFNNRLHDKFIIIDGEKFLLGGRNLGDEYFLENENKKREVKDRDVYVEKIDFEKISSVNRLEDYFNAVWNSKYSKPVEKN